jgi:hypothetical protein
MIKRISHCDKLSTNTVACNVFTVMILMYDWKWHDPLLFKNKEIYEGNEMVIYFVNFLLIILDHWRKIVD